MLSYTGSAELHLFSLISFRSGEVLLLITVVGDPFAVAARKAYSSVCPSSIDTVTVTGISNVYFCWERLSAALSTNFVFGPKSRSKIKWISWPVAPGYRWKQVIPHSLRSTKISVNLCFNLKQSFLSLLWKSDLAMSSLCSPMGHQSNQNKRAVAILEGFAAKHEKHQNWWVRAKHKAKATYQQQRQSPLIVIKNLEINSFSAHGDHGDHAPWHTDGWRFASRRLFATYVDRCRWN